MTLALTIRLAETQAAWLDVLAADFGIPVTTLARQLATPAALAHEVARYLVREGRADALHALTTGHPLHADDPPTLRQQVAQQTYALVDAQREAERERAEDEAWAKNLAA